MATLALQPVLIGADMNCSSVARAFHEAYGVTSQAFGRWPMGDTKWSGIVRCTYIENVDDPDVLYKTCLLYTSRCV